jgi:NADH-quinone oxidoreductase subunit K
LFLIGFFGAIVAKNVLKVLICVEFMLTAVNINFIAFASFFDNIKLNGFVFSLFYIATGAVEIAIALAIFYLMFKTKQSAATESKSSFGGWSGGSASGRHAIYHGYAGNND